MLKTWQANAVGEISSILYRFLSASEFFDVATKLGLAGFWPEMSKTRALTSLLEQTLCDDRKEFRKLIEAIVVEGVKKNAGGVNAVSRVEVERLNALLGDLRCKVASITDSRFLSGLAGSSSEFGAVRTDASRSLSKPNGASVDYALLKKKLQEVACMSPQERGFAFEQYLQELFVAFGLKPRSAFRITGEQIDGSIVLDTDTYLIEAKWQSALVVQSELAVFASRVGGHSSVGRGLFISINGFSSSGVEAFRRGSPSSIVGIDGSDLYVLLDNGLSLADVVRAKMRKLVEEGEFYYAVLRLLHEL